ncbi:MAG: MMPL family transporter [Solirubrobacterales bacterium]
MNEPSAVRRIFDPLLKLVTDHRLKVIPLVAGVFISVLFLSFGGSPATTSDPTFGLPENAESTEAVRLQQNLPESGEAPAIVVYSRPDGKLNAADRKEINRDRKAFAGIALGKAVGPPVYSPGDEAAIVSVPLKSVPEGGGGEGSDRLGIEVNEIRDVAGQGLPDGAVAEVTGPAAFQVDLSEVFEGADTRLLMATAAIVALLLLITYRSPWLWLVPLTVIALADQVVLALLSILSRNTGLEIDGATTGIVSVLVFGAGTNYALLLVARYREELRRHEERHRAMRAALVHAAPAILASSGTVALSLATLYFAELPFDRNIGVAGSIGIITAVVFVLGMLPPALLLFGRKLFWPVVPRYGDDDPSRTGPWSKLGEAVTARAVTVTLVSVMFLVVLALGNTGGDVGLSQTEQLRDRPDSVAGQETLARTFGAGTGEPAAVIVPAAEASAARQVSAATDGVAAARPGPTGGGVAQIDVQLQDAPGSDGALATIENLRTDLDQVSKEALVGGQDASDLDKREAAANDRLLVVPLVLAVVLLILLLLLRSVVAAVLLTLTNVLSWAAALGAATWAFDHIFGFPGIDLSVPLLSFLFLVALGVDYNIFLITRAREEAKTESTRRSIVTALATTGGVITSAGILLAAVFTVLGVLPIITLTQLGIIVGFGILLDTLLVRTVLVPAMVTLVGDRFWWPANPRSEKSGR